jgi:23S rRNA (uracil1939-C5)-methyltransferase
MSKEIVKVKCVDYTFDGQGLAKYGNRVIFVPSLLKDEEAEVELLYRKKDFDVGRIVKLIKLSKYRIKPRCPIATACGGCCFQNLDYKEQLRVKKETSLETLQKIGGVDMTRFGDIYGMDDPYFYRNKIQVPFGYDKQKRLVYGFYKFKSHDIVPIEQCVIEDEVHVNILKTIKKLMLEMKIRAYDEDSDTGIVRHVLIRTGKISKETMVVIVVRRDNFPSKNNFVAAFKEACPEVKTLVFDINSRRTNVILGEKEYVAYGPGFIYDSLCGVKFKISSRSFYQINHDQCEKLYSLAIDKAELTGGETILDAYCGIGTIGLIASKKVAQVDGFEVVSDAIKDAKENAKLNGITNAEFFACDAKNFIQRKPYDVIFVDPPRKGLDEAFVSFLLKSKVKKIIYVSCDVGTLARDLKTLQVKYDVKSFDFVDMFPHTYHVETVVALVLKK